MGDLKTENGGEPIFNVSYRRDIMRWAFDCTAGKILTEFVLHSTFCFPSDALEHNKIYSSMSVGK
jgi:hypothetical protein